MISTSMLRRLLLPKCSINDDPPLNMNGHPERASDSSKEKALITFSTRIGFVGRFCFATFFIHSRERLSGKIILYFFNYGF